MPVHECTLSGGKRGWKWGKSGKCYRTRGQAERQAAAIYASGWREKIASLLPLIGKTTLGRLLEPRDRKQKQTERYVDQHTRQVSMKIKAILRKEAKRLAEGLIDLNSNKVDFGVLLKAKEKSLFSMKLTARDVDNYLDSLDDEELLEIADEVMTSLGSAYREGAKAAVKDLHTQDLFAPSRMGEVDEAATEWAEDHGADLVGRRINDKGRMVRASTKYSIPKATREMLRDDIVDAIKEGMSPDELREVIVSHYGFSDERAETIARTELSRAYAQGSLEVWRRSGVVEKKRWITAPDCCEECEAVRNEEVDLDDDFSNGEDGPPLHPNCRCDIMAVVIEDEKVSRTLTLFGGTTDLAMLFKYNECHDPDSGEFCEGGGGGEGGGKGKATVYTGTYRAYTARGKRVSFSYSVRAKDSYEANDKVKAQAERKFKTKDLYYPVITSSGGKRRFRVSASGRRAAAGAGPEED